MVVRHHLCNLFKKRSDIHSHIVPEIVIISTYQNVEQAWLNDNLDTEVSKFGILLQKKLETVNH